MKRILFTLLSLSFSFVVRAQDAENGNFEIPNRSSDLFFGVAAITGWGLNSPPTYVLGGEFFLQKDFGGSISGTLSGGYVHHAFDHNWRKSISIHDAGYTEEYRMSGYEAIPLKAGIRKYTGEKLFFGFEVGVSLGLNQPGILKTTDINGTVERTLYRADNSFVYAVSAEYSFDNGFETGVKFENYTNFRHIRQLNLRVAYKLKL